MHDPAMSRWPDEESTEPGKRSGNGGRRRAEVHRGRTIAKVLGITLLVLSLITGLTMVYLYRHFSGNLTVLDPDDDIVAERADKIEVDGSGEPLNILVMGSDSRDCQGCALDQHVNSGERSDTTILIHLSADRERAYGISIPRDTMVDRPDCKGRDGETVPAADYQMFNSAFTIGGPACTIAQFEAMSDVYVDHFVVVDFTSFKSMVDAVGGVEVCIPETIDDRDHGIYLEAGTREIDGQEALDYVRVRKGIGDGSDLSRTKRQQAFIGAMANTVLSSGTLTNPVKVVRFLDAATKGLTVDPGLGDLKKLASLGMGFADIGLNKIQFMTIPVGADPEDPNRVVLSADADKVWRKIRRDKPLGKELSDQTLRASSLPGRNEGGSSKKGQDEPSEESTKAPEETEAPGDENPGDAPSEPPSLDAAELEYAGLCA